MTKRAIDQVPMEGIIIQMNKWRDDAFYWKRECKYARQDAEEWRGMCGLLKDTIQKEETT